MAVKFFVAFWMKQDTIFLCITASLTPPNDMVAVPPRQFGDFLVAEWTEAILLFPEEEQLLFPFEVVCHFHIETLFKVGLPFWVIGVVSASLNLTHFANLA